MQQHDCSQESAGIYPRQRLNNNHKRGPKGANKWTLLRVTKELQDIHGAIIADPTIVVMGEVIESKPYSHQRVSEWVKTYGANHEIVGQLYEKIKSLLETRILSQAMKGGVKPLMAIFCLKNLYGYKDQAELGLTGNVTSTIIERKIELPVKKDEMTPVTPKGQK